MRVPTNDEGTCLFWEFATDYYDIGFGVYFEWTKSPTNQVSVHVSESEDEEDYPNEDDEDDEDDGENSRVVQIFMPLNSQGFHPRACELGG